ncbi:MAG: glycosyltransferase family 2 protein [candidate division KSB1 bacterium]|nr:glycosyltransferase family 2 protein [candidate division KSB1 bacterium]MDZ7366968.1 glycosyltransferase family 2 protein [candidate division KSB1 bacterium]MDZ7406853.1 glycosyltransferase family 2 protein [candidate division KSB1 bacterium]
MPSSLVASLPDTIAIIIVTFQNAGEIAACLRSLREAAPEHRIRLFLIDNASTDATRPIIAATLAELPASRFFIKFIFNEENAGFTRAVNQGLENYLALAGHELAPVLFLNPDTILPAGSLAALLKKLYAFSDAGVIAPQLVHQDGRIQPSCRRFPTHADLFCELLGLSRLFSRSPRFNRWKMGDFDHRQAAEVDQPQGACLLARPEVVKQVGRWDERFPIFFSDVDWCRRVWENGWKIRFEPAVQIIHAQGVSVRQVRAAAIWSSHISFWRYLRKHESGWREKFWNVILGPLLVVTAMVRMIPYLSKVIFRVATKSPASM